MLTCALDVREGSIRLVLVACSNPPEVIEGHCFPRAVRPARVLARLADWNEYYQGAPDRLVCSREDPLPGGLVEALEAAGHAIEWVRGVDVDAVAAAWKRIRPDPRWVRGGLMASLAQAPLAPGSYEATAHATALAEDWLYTCLLQQVEDMRAWLVAEGRIDRTTEQVPYCEGF